MREQLKLLDELQQHDARLQELGAIRASLPQKLQEAKKAISELERILERERAELADNEAFRRQQQDEQRQSEALISKTKAKLSQVRNLKESNAVQRELDSARKQLEMREEEMKKLAQAMEERSRKITEQEEKLMRDRKELSEQEVELGKRLAEIEAQIALARATRDEAARQLRPDVLKKYGAIKMRRGLAVVAVKNGTCSGCNMRIPPQLFNILQRGTSLELCPSCNRIVYWDQLLVEQREAL